MCSTLDHTRPLIKIFFLIPVLYYNKEGMVNTKYVFQWLLSPGRQHPFSDTTYSLAILFIIIMHT